MPGPSAGIQWREVRGYPWPRLRPHPHICALRGERGLPGPPPVKLLLVFPSLDLVLSAHKSIKGAELCQLSGKIRRSPAKSALARGRAHDNEILWRVFADFPQKNGTEIQVIPKP